MLAFDENGNQIPNNEIIDTRSNTTQRKDSTSESCSTKNPKPWVQETNIPTSNKFEVLNIPEPNESNFQEQMESDLVDHDSEYPNNQLGPTGTEFSSNDVNPESSAINRNSNKRNREKMGNSPLPNNENEDNDSWDEPSTS
ncbi:hypothetical protein JTB14_018755 [Gonioctena quinquepunctata]|nr:hypothetical protein JTB14_018755 [Gonioctena quinquepunctata]